MYYCLSDGGFLCAGQDPAVTQYIFKAETQNTRII